MFIFNSLIFPKEIVLSKKILFVSELTIGIEEGDENYIFRSVRNISVDFEININAIDKLTRKARL